ncbi:3-oxoacyl-ACP reductase FabG [Mesorhizobium sp. CA13]|uniref:SDR family NAD(P)-dependent oxidoreductase n=1 Tax=unclassified Mesorhizobium TaxID=325217 RepID=UPI00112E8ADE|nr:MULTISPECIES: 3-oxoacyl-ACP reductase FabG [unclassified Mesorhizobium]MBZ9856500.1 3-oxoacyl-ACP reductase FabG [Mesorhizobium sp. CA13]MBZ9965753.1 3-oxoacyl-ACP reductase FabG [Mesorhizobium sp. BR1-1-2]MCA0011870.1 3-oxoacyl-ACP reductase FabG [Mesorhizobium sp. B294B1A1]MCA0038124.1 3-oxoacyl-ACP reductase FabG [Mesorhizobium sp. B292B1B]TPM44140.1 SDR family oxidoreductase [Mesorhizobium sp. B2-3-2]
MSGRLAGKKALVTGGARGIGGAIATAFAREGADVAVLDLKLEAAEARTSALADFGVKTFAVAADVSDEAQVEAAVKKVEAALGQIDILVNNAGIDTTSVVAEMSTGMWDQMMAVNLRSVFLCTRAVLKPMISRKFGRIINIASQLGHKGAPEMAHYAAAKAGVIGFTRSLAYEVARDGITVNAICPGPIETELFRALPEEWKKRKLGELPIGRAGHVDEIAPTAVLLASEEGAYYIGATMNPNGGDVML